MKTRFKYLSLLIFAFFIIKANGYSEDPKDLGKSTFTTYCTSCHRLGTVLTGPDLIDVDKRRNINWIIQFVRSSQSVIKNGDKEAVALFEKFNKIQMPAHPFLKEIEIKNIVEYIKFESLNAPKDKAPLITPAVVKQNYLPLTKSNYGFIIAYLTLVITLVGVLFFAVNVQVFRNKKIENS
jgi:mono/diheme cytochrome c family protein